MDWVRGELIGRGSFGSVNLAIPTISNGAPPLMAVKSCWSPHSAALRREKEVLTVLADCPQIIRCFGDCWNEEDGESLYSVLLEYAPGGNMADRVRNPLSGAGGCGGGLPESQVRRYTGSILKALSHVHGKGLVHCDVKLQNILLFPWQNGDRVEDDVKIADFGLCTTAGERRGFEIRGTPLYMSPESVTSGEYEPPADIWALGCAVAEMVTGKPAWRCEAGTDVPRLLFRIGTGNESPEAPATLSEEGKDFLGKCFVKDPRKRWTAEMLLNHPFVLTNDGEAAAPLGSVKKAEPSTSPRGPLEYTECATVKCDYSVGSSMSAAPLSEPPLWFNGESGLFDESGRTTPGRWPAADRIQQLAGGVAPDWSFYDDWIGIR